MRAMRRHFSAHFKAEIVQQVLREEKTIAEIASEHEIHPNQIKRWKATAVKGLPSLFSDETAAAKTAKASKEKQLDELYAEIGRLSTQLAWLPRNCALTGGRS
jgi:transposase-like protein